MPFTHTAIRRALFNRSENAQDTSEALWAEANVLRQALEDEGYRDVSISVAFHEHDIEVTATGVADRG